MCLCVSMADGSHYTSTRDDEMMRFAEFVIKQMIQLSPRVPAKDRVLLATAKDVDTLDEEYRVMVMRILAEDGLALS